ncbi:MAG: hypothetical protein IK022_05800 [Bacteroidales bacterium]|nr:hypothetical protein [Bacteroidales bacterium]
MTIITVILLICFLATLFMLFSIRTRLTRKIDELSSRHLKAIQMLDHQQQENTKVKKQFADNDKNQFHLLNELCAAYWSPIKNRIRKRDQQQRRQHNGQAARRLAISLFDTVFPQYVNDRFFY